MPLSVSTTTAFAPSPSRSPSTPQWQAACPLASNNNSSLCDFQASSSSSSSLLIHHLVKKHKAAQYDVFFGEQGATEIQFDTTIPVKEGAVRRTAVLLSLPDESVLCYCIDTKRRADGELQASSSIQMLQGPPSSSASVNHFSIEEQLEVPVSVKFSAASAASPSSSSTATSSSAVTQPLSSSFSSSSSSTARQGRYPTTIQIDEPTPRAPPELDASPKTSSPVRNSPATGQYDDEHDDVHETTAYVATIIAGVSVEPTIEQQRSQQSQQSQQQQSQHHPNDRTIEWRGILNDQRLPCSHERLTSHSEALIALYPTQSWLFQTTTRMNARGEAEEALLLPIRLRLEKVSCPKGW